MAPGAEGDALGTGVAVHLAVDLHGLSGWTQKNREHYSTTARTNANHNSKGSVGVQISGAEHESQMIQKKPNRNQKMDG